ncbi:MAG: ribosomal-processing cysteine protease Prp [Firmicutes bacterium]|nr:ribosomal-processing cysteine protease Prp [Bacillota bacterium]
MTKVTVSKNLGGEIIKLSATGHAEYAALGYDIVCAATSAIIQTACLGLTKFDCCEIKKSDGNIYIKVCAPTTQNQLILNTMMLGLHDLQTQYPKYIKIKEETK